MADDNTQQLACVYASLILHDDGLQVTPDKLIKLLNAAKISVNPFWPSLFSDTLKNRDLTELALSGIGAGAGPAPAAAAVTGAAEAAPAAAAAEKKEEKKEASEEEEMELDLFG